MKTCLIVAGVIGALFLTLVVGAIVWAVYMFNSYSMPDAVVRGSQLTPTVAKAIDKKVGLRPGEKIEFFYSSGLPPQASGLVVTNQRIMQYDFLTPLEQADYANIVQASGSSFITVSTGDDELYMMLHDDPAQNAPLLEYVASHGKVGIKKGSDKIPGEQLLSDDDLTPQGREAIERFVEFAPDEKILYFHAYGFWTFDDGGSVVTDRRIIEISVWDGETTVEEAPFDQIVQVIPAETSLEVEVVGSEAAIYVELVEPDNARQVRDYLEQRGVKFGEPRPVEAEDFSDEAMEADAMEEEDSTDLPPTDEEAPSEETPLDDPDGAESPDKDTIEEPALP